MILIIGGGTVSHCRNHLALAAPAYGETARIIYRILHRKGAFETMLVQTKMASPSGAIETPEHLINYVDDVLKNPNLKVIIFNVAVVDFQMVIDDVPPGKYATRLQTRDDSEHNIKLIPTPKILSTIKARRPDVFVVGFKTTCNESIDVQVEKAKRQIDEANVDLVLANDTGTRSNVLVRSYDVETFDDDRYRALNRMADIIISNTNVSLRAVALHGDSEEVFC